jgi:hypothetical protein
MHPEKLALWVTCEYAADNSVRGDADETAGMRCKDCSEIRGYPFKRSHLVALRPTKISPSDPPSSWWRGER